MESYIPKRVSPTLMPPQNFRITRRVGSDSLLVAWTPPNDNEVTGYLVSKNTIVYHLKFCQFLNVTLFDIIGKYFVIKL